MFSDCVTNYNPLPRRYLYCFALDNNDQVTTRCFECFLRMSFCVVLYAPRKTNSKRNFPLQVAIFWPASRPRSIASGDLSSIKRRRVKRSLLWNRSLAIRTSLLSSRSKRSTRRWNLNIHPRKLIAIPAFTSRSKRIIFLARRTWVTIELSYSCGTRS